MSPKVPKAYLDARRQEIIEAAMECILEKGFHSMTMQDIYDVTKLSPGAVYNYFKGKEDIVAAATEIARQRNIEAISMATVEDVDDTLRNIGQTVSSWWKQMDVSKIASLDYDLYSEASRNPRIAELLRKNLDAVFTRLANIIKQGQDDGVINRELNPMAITQALFSLVDGVKILKLLYPEMDIDSYMSVYDSMIRGTFTRQEKEQR